MGKKNPLKPILDGLKSIPKKVNKTILEPFKKLFAMIKGLGKTFSNLLKPILDILKGLGKMFSSLLKPIMKILKTMVKQMTALFKKVMGILTKIISLLKNAFLSIFYYIKCAIERMKNSPKCILYYVIDTIFFTLLIPVRILILVFPALEELEEMFRDGVQKIDVIVHRISMSTIGKGVHINKWPDGVLNKCYRCKAKYEDPEGFEDFLTKLFTYNGNTQNFFFFFLNAFTFCIVGFLIYANLLKRTSTCTKNINIDKDGKGTKQAI